MEELVPQYNPQATEANIYKLWEESGYFNPDNLPDADKRPPYSIVLPPPNVTGTLHIGNALMLVIQDILIRYHRMKGFKTLWLPGTDHAAIATHARVESILYKEEGKTRYDLGREEFVRRVEKFAQDNRDTIVGQIKKMGASTDWSREAYTFDEARSLAVRTAFKNMYDDGLIYRGSRLVNWDPKMQTTVSDDEIEWRDETAPLYYLKYGPFIIATARPETKFGDKYVVMHPEDARYQKFSDGQKIELEWINGPITATVIKDSDIDMEFGTGVMTITPSHDATDFEIAKRHDLDFEAIIDFNGKLLPIADEFSGTHIKRARPLIVEKLKAKGLIEKIDEAYAHRVATNSRGGGIIEPQIKEQWFVNVNKEFAMAKSKLKGTETGDLTTLKKLMRQAVQSKEIKIIPEHFEKIYFHWIDNLRDWCISRQIWFGHRIPVWYCLACGAIKVSPEIKSRWFIVRHGQTDGNIERRMMGSGSDLPLNDTGREQAKNAALQLKNNDIGVIISSDLKRAKETAEIISKGTGAPIIIDADFREKHHGDAESMKIDEATEKYGDPYQYETSAPNGESYRELEDRIHAAFLGHKEKHGAKNVVIVSHGGALQTLISKIRNLTPTEMLLRPSVKNGEIVSLDILKPCPKCGGDLFEQDPDTLDTWFSSGLWTFSTLGWPTFADTGQAGKPGIQNDLANYHPTTVIETGYDILPFWVARMILMSTYHMGEIPFRTVYLHGLIRDKDRQKMSKSKGNIVDPLGVTEIYGTDALRFALIFSTAAGNDIPLAEEKIRGMKHFANKLWNIARYVLANCELRIMNKGFDDIIHTSSFMIHAGQTDADKNILEKLATTIQDVTEHLENFRLHEAAQSIYQFTWHEFADVYLEISKAQLKDAEQKKNTEAILSHTLVSVLKLLHPFMPFITEELYQKVTPRKPNAKKMLMVEAWPLI